MFELMDSRGVWDASVNAWFGSDFASSFSVFGPYSGTSVTDQVPPQHGAFFNVVYCDEHVTSRAISLLN
jgi:hypothetical protein